MKVTINYVDPRPKPIKSVLIELTTDEVGLLKKVLALAESERYSPLYSMRRRTRFDEDFRKFIIDLQKQLHEELPR